MPLKLSPTHQQAAQKAIQELRGHFHKYITMDSTVQRLKRHHHTLVTVNTTRQKIKKDSQTPRTMQMFRDRQHNELWTGVKCIRVKH